MNNQILRNTQTALFVALLVVVQAATMPMGSTIVTGSAVNLLLILSVMLLRASLRPYGGCDVADHCPLFWNRAPLGHNPVYYFRQYSSGFSMAPYWQPVKNQEALRLFSRSCRGCAHKICGFVCWYCKNSNTPFSEFA